MLDGHGGVAVALAAAYLIETTIALKDVVSERTLSEFFLTVDATLRRRFEPSFMFQGSTCVLVCVRRHARGWTLLGGHIGDTRALLMRNAGSDTAVAAATYTRDHKPDDASETARIKAAGGAVDIPKKKEISTAARVYVPKKKKQQESFYRMSCSRGFGDFDFKRSEQHHVITEEPSTWGLSVGASDDAWLVLACDGVWDVFDDLLDERDRDAVARAKPGLPLIEVPTFGPQHSWCPRNLLSPDEVAKFFVTRALWPPVSSVIPSGDNITALAIHLKQQ